MRNRIKRVALVVASALVVGGAMAVVDAAPAQAVAAHAPKWTAPGLVRHQRVSSTACSAHRCFATTEKGLTSTYNGKTWSAFVNLLPGGAYPECQSGATCVASNDKYVVGYDGHSWGRRKALPALPKVTTDLYIATCASTSFCLAVTTVDNPQGSDYYRHTDGYLFEGRAWRSLGKIADDAIQVTCVSAKFCEGVSVNGELTVTWNGTRWTQTLLHSTTGFPGSLQCWSAKLCAFTTFQPFTAKANGQAYVFNGKTWGRPALKNTSGGALSDAACVPGRCITVAGPTNTGMGATKGDGYARVRLGSRWSAPARIDRGTGIDSLACGSASLCAAVDLSGRVLLAR